MDLVLLETGETLTSHITAWCTLWLLNECKFSMILVPGEQRQYLSIVHFLYVRSLVIRYQKGYFWLWSVNIDPYPLEDAQNIIIYPFSAAIFI